MQKILLAYFEADYIETEHLLGGLAKALTVSLRIYYTIMNYGSFIRKHYRKYELIRYFTSRF